MKRIAPALLTLLVPMLLAGASAVADGEQKSLSHDGLALAKQSRHTRLWTRPGATLAPYRRVELLDCAIAFRKDWQRDQNEDRESLGAQVTKRDMDRIEQQLAKDFRRVFTTELEKRGGYDVIDAGEKATEGAKDVLLLRPAIIDLDVGSPEVMDAEMSTTFSNAAVAMTIYLELFDSASGQIIARFVDAEGDSEAGVTMSSGVENTAVEDRILERWAERLRKGLDQAHAQMGR